MKQLFGGILLAIGILIAGASGLCSLAVLLTPGEHGGGGMLGAVLLIGGIPFALGAAMALGGHMLLKQARKEGEQTGGDVSKTVE
jgi:hypothetical protein